MEARWKNRVIASSDDIVTVEGNAYFPADSLDAGCIRPSPHRTVCGWKGVAHYYDVVVDGFDQLVDGFNPLVERGLSPPA